MSEWSIEHAWKLLWRFATACYGFRLPLRSQPLSGERVYAVDPLPTGTLRRPQARPRDHRRSARALKVTYTEEASPIS